MLGTTNLFTRRFLQFAVCGILSLCAVSLSARGEPQTNKQDIVKQARQASCSLRRLGLVEYSATITPNWELLLKDEIKADPEGAQAGLKLLSGLRFAMTLDKDGKVNVTHQSDAPAADEKQAAAFKQIFDGMDETISGFFATWEPFMLTSPFPAAEGDFQLNNVENGYRLIYSEGPTGIVTTMTKDFSITSLVISATDFKSSIKPRFSKSNLGLVISSYEGVYTPISGPGSTHLNVQIDYLDSNGLRLPRKVTLDGDINGSPFAAELLFSDYKVKVR